MFRTENDILKAISAYVSEFQETPTLEDFAKKHEIHASSLIRKFGSWNILLKKLGLRPHKSEKRTEQELLSWLKSHPNVRYSEIPCGIRNRLEDIYGSITKARQAAGLLIVDWRMASKKQNKKGKGGRPIEYSKEYIIEVLNSFAAKLGRPPKAKEITKENCNFTLTALISRFGSFNAALNAASLPLNSTHQELTKLTRDFEILMLNIKLCLGEVPNYFNCNSGFSSFLYSDRTEIIVLTRSEIFLETKLETCKKEKNIKIWYLIDDYLGDLDGISLICAMDINEKIKSLNEGLYLSLISLRTRYDDISRMFIGQPL